MNAERKWLLCFVFLIAWLSSGVVAGSLTPPAGAPAPTHKPIDEVEPRTPIDAEHTPGNSLYLFEIDQPGSYYLTGNVTGVAGKGGINVAVSNVTIDLSGYALRGVASSGKDISGTSATVRNGTIQGWGEGGISLSGYCVVEDVISRENVGPGILINYGIIRNCVSESNDTYGYRISGYGIVSDSTSHYNETGIWVGWSSMVIRCTVSRNTGDGIWVHTSIPALSGYTLVSESSVSLNGGCGITGVGYSFGSNGPGINQSIVADCSVYQNGEAGILCLDSCLVLRCTVQGNTNNGIHGRYLCTIRDNLCDSNGGDGILVTRLSRVEGNLCTDNARGIHVLEFYNFIIQNSCGGSSVENWRVASGNMCYVAIPDNCAAIVGDSGGTGTYLHMSFCNFTF